jgi:hypothetical protein
MAAQIRLSQHHSCSFDDLLGGHLQRQWQAKTERLGGFEVDDELEFRRLLDLGPSAARAPRAAS